MACTIEKIEISGEPMPHDMVSEILSIKNTALAAIGSLACIRTLWFRAYRLGKLHHFYGTVVTEAEYALGNQIRRLKECIQKAAEEETIEHIVVYASCFEILMMCDLEEELADLDLPEGVSLHIFYRGPLVKRIRKPQETLQRIKEEIKRTKGAGKKKCHRKETRSMGDPPPLPDFARIMLQLRDKDCDVLLLSPGGCKSCIEESVSAEDIRMEESSQQIKADFYTTRLDDLSISQGCPELFSVIRDTFSGSRPLILVESAVFHVVGFDTQYLTTCLNQTGIRTIFIKSDGFKTKYEIDCEIIKSI